MIANFSDHAANERTFLAWVRTAMALVGFGLALSRLGSAAPSPRVEIALVALGGLVVAIAFLRMHLLLRHIETPQTQPYAGGVLGVTMGLAVAALAALIALFAAGLI